MDSDERGIPPRESGLKQVERRFHPADRGQSAGTQQRQHRGVEIDLARWKQEGLSFGGVADMAERGRRQKQCRGCGQGLCGEGFGEGGGSGKHA